jgi:diguanylate cyclase (GGDEF)-like protein
MTNPDFSKRKTSAAAPSIRTKLAKLVIGCVLPIASVAAFLIFNFYQQEQAQLTKNAIGRAQLLVATVDRVFGATQASLMTLATSQRLAQGDFEGFHRRAIEVLENMRADSIVLVGMDAQLLLATNRPFGTPLPKLTNAPLLARVIKTGSPAVSDLYLGPIVGKPIYALGVPVQHDGKLAFLLAATASPGSMNTILTEQNFPDSWRAVIADSTGTIVARTHNTHNFTGRKVLPALIQRMKTTEQGSYHGNNQEGIPVTTVYSKSPSTGWVVGIAVPLEELTSGLRQTLAWLIVATIAALLAGIWFAWVIGDRIADSITTLGASAKVLGQRGQPLIPKLHFKEAVELGDALLEAASNLRSAQFDADHDALTGLPNRSLFRLLLNGHLALCQRNSKSLAILFIDLDGFKAVNDTLGHPAGDQLLRAVAARVKGVMRASDFCARLGGDEFAVALPQTTMGNAAAFAAKLIGEISRPYQLAQINASISASVGIAEYPTSGLEMDVLLAQADRAMYEAKRGGKQRVSLSSHRAAR